MEKMKKIKAILIVVAAIFIMGLTPTVSADEVNFSQIDFHLDGVPTLDSDWGSVDFTFTGQDPIMYFNLAVNGSWQVQNIPVLSRRGVGVEQTMTYFFDLGTECGTDVTSLNYDYAFTSNILDTMPGGSSPASVGDDSIALWAGFEGGLMPELAAAKPLVGGKVSSDKKHAHKDFPNQDCNDRECAPAAVSNSLKFLNTKHNLGLTDAQINITTMKKAVGFKKGWGSPLDTWWEKKKKYMEDNKYPITTKKVTNMSKLAAEIDAGQDVEIQESWWYKNKTTGVWKKTGHTLCLTGIKKLKNGNYSLNVADDLEQNKTGGLSNRSIIYNSTTGIIKELWGLVKFEYAVVECPPAINLTNLGPEYQEVLPDETATYTIRVTNLGSETDTIQLKHENVFESGACSWTVGLSKDSFTLDSDAHDDVTLSVTAPSDCEISSRIKVKVTGTSQNGLDCGVTITDSVIKETHNVPEFTTIAIPVAAILGLVFLFSRRRRKE